MAITDLTKHYRDVFAPDRLKIYNGATAWEKEGRPAITDLIKHYWDMFAPDGLRNHIKGILCATYNGNHCLD